MNLSHIYYFRGLVEAGSFSKASENLFVSVSTISSALTSLEKELGVPLLSKKRSTIALTEEGETFYTAALTVTNALDRCKESFAAKSLERYSRIRIGMVYSIQSEEWSSMLRRIRRKMGRQIRFDLLQGVTETLLRDLSAGQFDVVFTGTLPERDPNIVMVPSYSQRAVLAVNKEHPLASRKSVKLDDLIGCKVVTYRQNEGPFIDELKALLAKHPYLKIFHEYNDEITLGSVVSGNSDEVAIVCYNWLMQAFSGLRLLEIEDAPADFHRFYMCYRANERRNPTLERFLELIKKEKFGNVSPPPE